MNGHSITHVRAAIKFLLIFCARFDRFCSSVQKCIQAKLKHLALLHFILTEGARNGAAWRNMDCDPLRWSKPMCTVSADLLRELRTDGGRMFQYSKSPETQTVWRAIY